MRAHMMVEGVPYTAFLVRFTTNDGRRHVKTLWMPAAFPQRETVVRYLEERGDVDASKNVTVRAKSP